MNTNINLTEFAGVVAALMLVGAFLKNAVPQLPSRWIPLVTWALALVGWMALTKGWSDPAQWIAGIVAAATATGMHSGIKNTAQLITGDKGEE